MKDVTEGMIKAVVCSENDVHAQGLMVGLEQITKITREIDEAVGVAYIRVWKGDKLFAEYDQSTIAGIYYETEGGK